MSVMSGLDLLTLMRNQGYHAPFIFITAFPDESVRARALEAGAIGFLAKPFAAPTLINASRTRSGDTSAKQIRKSVRLAPCISAGMAHSNPFRP
jgi:FixJ family two-component response regulator